MAATKAARIRELEAALDGSARDIRLLQKLMEILKIEDVDEIPHEVEKLQIALQRAQLQTWSVADLRKLLKVLRAKRKLCTGLDPLRCNDPNCPIHGEQVQQ